MYRVRLKESSYGVANWPHLLRSAGDLRLSRRACSACLCPSIVWCCAEAIVSNSELVEVFGAVFPDPVYALRGFVPKIRSVEISAEKKHKENVLAVGGLQLVDFGGLFLTPFIHVREVACGFSFDEYRQLRQFRILPLNDRVDRDFYRLRLGRRRFHQHIHPEGKCARFHHIERC